VASGESSYACYEGSHISPLLWVNPSQSPGERNCFPDML
jgi:hypothetical protein